MTNSEQSQESNKPATRFVWFSKYEGAPVDESTDSTDSVKNFPKAFIPMEELKESTSDE